MLIAIVKVLAGAPSRDLKARLSDTSADAFADSGKRMIAGFIWSGFFIGPRFIGPGFSGPSAQGLSSGKRCL
ncbi:MAG: hypothetical protein KDJ29_04785 [Hyphomicrobiales bacterium]|nr:hypothetical protein [Hyphomicrobiales bacterium]